MTEQEDKQKQQEMIFKLSIFEQQIRQLQQQIHAVEQAIVDMNTLNFGLDELKGKKGEEIFAPIGRGIFARTKLISEDLTVDVGGGNLVKKNIEDTKGMIKEQIKKLEVARRELNDNLEKVGMELQRMMNEGV